MEVGSLLQMQRSGQSQGSDLWGRERFSASGRALRRLRNETIVRIRADTLEFQERCDQPRRGCGTINLGGDVGTKSPRTIRGDVGTKSPRTIPTSSLRPVGLHRAGAPSVPLRQVRRSSLAILQELDANDEHRSVTVRDGRRASAPFKPPQFSRSYARQARTRENHRRQRELLPPAGSTLVSVTPRQLNLELSSIVSVQRR